MTNISGIVIGISVDSIQGIEAEKNNISDTHNTPITNLVINGATVTNNAGKNI